MFSDLFPLQTPPWVVLCVSSELWGYPDGQPDGGLGSWILDVLSHSSDDFGCVFWIRIIPCSASGRQYFLAGHHLQQPGVLLQEGMGQASTVPCPDHFWWFLAGRKIPWCPELFETSSQIGGIWTRGAVNRCRDGLPGFACCLNLGSSTFAMWLGVKILRHVGNRNERFILVE